MFIAGSTNAGKTTYLTLFQIYTKGQNYTVSLEIWNLVSQANITTTFQVYEEISPLSFTLTYTDPITYTPVQLDGTLGDIYIPTECSVTYLVSYSHGSHVALRFEHDDDIIDYQYTEKIHSIKRMPRGVTESRRLILTATNPKSNYMLTATVHYQTSVNNTSLKCHSPNYQNYDTACWVGLGNIATDVCYFINWGFPDDADIQYAWFGNKAQCMEDHLTEMTGSQVVQLTPTLVPDTTILPRYHNFTDRGPYWVSLTVTNKVSRQTPGFRMLVTRGPCWPPEIDLITPNYCDDTGQCQDTSVPLEFWKSVKVTVKSAVKYNCSFSHSGYFHWRIYYIHDIKNRIG